METIKQTKGLLEGKYCEVRQTHKSHHDIASEAKSTVWYILRPVCQGYTSSIDPILQVLQIFC